MQYSNVPLADCPKPSTTRKRPSRDNDGPYCSTLMEWTCERLVFESAAEPPTQTPAPSQRLMDALSEALAAMRDEPTHYAAPHERDIITALTTVCATAVRRAAVVDTSRGVAATFSALMASLDSLVLEPCDTARLRLLDAAAESAAAIQKDIVRLKATNALSGATPSGANPSGANQDGANQDGANPGGADSDDD